MRPPIPNPRTIALMKTFAKEMGAAVDMLLCVGYDSDVKKLEMRMMELTLKQIAGVQTYAAKIHATATHGGKKPKPPQYVKRVLDGWKP